MDDAQGHTISIDLPDPRRLAFLVQGLRRTADVADVPQTEPDRLAPLLLGDGVRHGSMRQTAAVKVTATGGQIHGPEPELQARGGAGVRPDR